MPTKLEDLNIIRIIHSEISGEMAGSLKIGGNLFTTDVKKDDMAYIIDALFYKDNEETWQTDSLNRRFYDVVGVGIRIALKYSSKNIGTKVNIPQLNAALKLRKTTVHRHIEGLGLGFEGLKRVIGANYSRTEEGKEVLTLDDFERFIKKVYNSLVNLIEEEPDLLRPEPISIFVPENKRNNFKKTQSFLFGLNEIIVNEKAFNEISSIPSPYIAEDVKSVYKFIMPDKSLDDKPEAQHIEVAKQMRFPIIKIKE